MDDLTVISCFGGTYARTKPFDDVVIDAGRILNSENSSIFRISLTY